MKDDETDNNINDDLVDISKIPQTIIQYVPNRYSIIKIVFVDLNGNNIDDAVIVLENTDTYDTKLQILFGIVSNTFFQYKIPDCNINIGDCEESFIGIKMVFSNVKLENGLSECTARIRLLLNTSNTLLLIIKCIYWTFFVNSRA